MTTAPPPHPAYPLPYATPQIPPRRWGKWIGWMVFVGIAALLLVLLKQQRPAYQAIPLSNFTEQLEQGNVSKVVIDGDELTGTLVTPCQIGGVTIRVYRTYLPAGSAGSWTFTEWLLAHRNGAVVRAEPNNNVLTNFVLPFIPWLLILVFIWFFVFRQLRSQLAQKQPMPVIVVNPEQRP